MERSEQSCQTIEGEFLIIDTNTNCCNNSQHLERTSMDSQGETQCRDKASPDETKEHEPDVHISVKRTCIYEDSFEEDQRTENNNSANEENPNPISKIDDKNMHKIQLSQVDNAEKTNSSDVSQERTVKRSDSNPIIYTADKTSTNEHHYNRSNSCGCGIQTQTSISGGFHVCGKDTDEECKKFMETIVDSIFSSNAPVVPEDSATFDDYCRTAEGRYYFAHLLNNRRVHQQRVSELTFYRLVQFFAICLFECNEAEDFAPATTLMNMCFTFQHVPEAGISSFNGEDDGDLSFLYSHLRDQFIWKSLRFWNAAFFTAMHQERSRWKSQLSPRDASPEEIMMADEVEGNTTFGQLATILHNMRELNIPNDTCVDFLEKISVIGNLSTEQCAMLEHQFNWDKRLSGGEKSVTPSSGVRRSKTLKKMKSFLSQSVDRKMLSMKRSKTLEELDAK